jgi:flagellar basal body-associated protein FliL
MTRLLYSFLLTLASCCVYAQSSAEAPVEHASVLTVIIFIVVFIAGCLGYVAYAWWSGKKEKERPGL